MSIYTKANKPSYGSPDYSDGGPNLAAADLNAGEDGIVNHINGELGNDNISTDAGERIDAVKIDDHQSSAAESRQHDAPGTACTPVQSASLEEEIEQLRYAVRRAQIGTNGLSEAASDVKTDASWQDGRIANHHNLLRNAGFEEFTSTSTPPTGWTEANTTSSITINDTDASVGYGKRVIVTGNTDPTHSYSGIQQVVTGLKESTKYVIGCQMANNLVGSGSYPRINISGGVANTSDYNDITWDTESDGPTVPGLPSSQYFTRWTIVETDASGSDLTVQFLGGIASFSVQFDNAFMYELSDDPVDSGTSYHNEDQDLVGTDITGTGANDWLDTEAEVTVSVPGPGYKVRLTARMFFKLDNNGVSTTRGQMRVYNSTTSAQHGYKIVSEQITSGAEEDHWKDWIHAVDMDPDPGENTYLIQVWDDLSGFKYVPKTPASEDGIWIRAEVERA